MPCEMRIAGGLGREDFGDDLVGALIQPRLGEAHRPRQQAHQFPVALAFSQRRDRLGVVGEHGVAVGLVQIGLLQLRRGRQDDIREIGRVGHEQIVNHGEQIVAHHPLHDQAGVGRGCHRVRPEDEQRADGWVFRFAQQRGSKAVHVDLATGWRTLRPFMY